MLTKPGPRKWKNWKKRINEYFFGYIQSKECYVAKADHALIRSWVSNHPGDIKVPTQIPYSSTHIVRSREKEENIKES